ncbi:MAG: efflux RND transporter periplasmic adaptor subunit [Gammaproteobacteria bacterium]|nr:efflux RND transporter periplasmic adaptor subunit [Gammaproteobacteria bacterium]
MSDNKGSTGVLITGVILGAVVTVGIFSVWFQPAGDSSSQGAATAEKKPLYWVAPMDPNYKRDKPGKSPMGMDLIPFYEEANTGVDEGPGTIRISPDVVNNLGVRTAVAKYGTLHSEIKTVGYVQYDEDQLVHIHPRVKGWIEKLYIKASGDPVEKGEPLYEIYSPELVNAQEELVFAMDRKNQRLIQAAVDRLKALQIPQVAINQLKRTKKVKQTITFFAPQSGVVDNLNIREGFFVQPGTTIMSIGALDQVWVEAEVFERQAFLVAEGSLVTMSLGFLPGRKWEGKVDYIYPTLDAKTRTLKVRLRFDNKAEELKPNMFAQVVIHARSADDTLLIPREAVIRTGSNDRVVLALGKGHFKSIKVEVGRFDEDSAEIISGIDEGEKVVSSAQFLLDSESSKTSDFKRMNNDDEDAGMATSVWVEATINSLMAGHRMLNVSHQAITAWDWPSMTMDFIVSEAVDFTRLKKGMTLDIKISKTDEGNFEVIDVRSAGDNNTATTNGVINSIMVGHRMLNISRGPIEKWNKGAATMNFIVSDEVDMSTLSEGMKIQFTFQITDGEFVVTDIQSNNQ